MHGQHEGTVTPLPLTLTLTLALALTLVCLGLQSNINEMGELSEMCHTIRSRARAAVAKASVSRCILGWRVFLLLLWFFLQL